MKVQYLITAGLLALLSCSKADDRSGGASGDAFREGQLVEITATYGADPADTDTRLTSSLNTSTGTISFTWESTDAIKVTAGGASATFTLKSGAGSKIAVFEGTMPGSGNSFDVEYPATGAPTLTTQTYSSSTEPLPKNMMYAKAQGCSLNAPFTLVPQNSVLRLNLRSAYSTTPHNQVKKIVVTNTTATSPQPTYTLNCSTAVALTSSSTDSTSFFIIVPAGSWNFSAAVYNGSDTLMNTYTKTSTKKYFTACETLNMPAREVKYGYPGTTEEAILINGIIWAPVNCGYDATHPYGLLYQWGRKFGSGYGTETELQTVVAGPLTDAKNEASTAFYTTSNADKMWLSTCDATFTSRWNGEGRATYDPCPTGWHIPKSDMLNSLIGNSRSLHLSGLQTGTGAHSAMSGHYFNGTTSSASSGVFLPAAGERNCSSGAVCSGRDAVGTYWAGDACNNAPNGKILRFDTNGASLKDPDYESVSAAGYVGLAYGYSVRCVHE